MAKVEFEEPRVGRTILWITEEKFEERFICMKPGFARVPAKAAEMAQDQDGRSYTVIQLTRPLGSPVAIIKELGIVVVVDDIVLIPPSTEGEDEKLRT